MMLTPWPLLSELWATDKSWDGLSMTVIRVQIFHKLPNYQLGFILSNIPPQGSISALSKFSIFNSRLCISLHGECILYSICLGLRTSRWRGMIIIFPLELFSSAAVLCLDSCQTRGCSKFKFYPNLPIVQFWQLHYKCWWVSWCL